MKLSISLPDEDVAFLDDYAKSAGLRSRSAAVHHAVRLLRMPELEDDYWAAWDEWVQSGEQDAWGTTTSDGLAGATR
jgi:Arc/MetJ-type ribon-helix-helix transcriptional regulator